MSGVVDSRDIGQGFTIDRLENDWGNTYYRVCRNSMCRYCEDEYVAYMYAENWGWLPASHQPL